MKYLAVKKARACTITKDAHDYFKSLNNDSNFDISDWNGTFNFEELFYINNDVVNFIMVIEDNKETNISVRDVKFISSSDGESIWHGECYVKLYYYVAGCPIYKYFSVAATQDILITSDLDYARTFIRGEDNV